MNNNELQPYLDLLIPLPAQLARNQLPCVIYHHGAIRWYRPEPFQIGSVYIFPHRTATDCTLTALSVTCYHSSIFETFELSLLNSAHLPFITYQFYNADHALYQSIHLHQPTDLLPHLRLLLSPSSQLQLYLRDDPWRLKGLNAPTPHDPLVLFCFFHVLALAVADRSTRWMPNLDFFIDLLPPLCDQLVTGQLRCDIVHRGLEQYPAEHPDEEGVEILPELHEYKPKSLKIAEVGVCVSNNYLEEDTVPRRAIVRCEHSQSHDSFRFNLYNAADHIFLQYEFSPVFYRRESFCVLQPRDLAVYLRLLHEDFYQYRQIYLSFGFDPRLLNSQSPWFLDEVVSESFTDEREELFFVVLSLALAYGKYDFEHE